jgi:glycosyltransferase involved in cell wall biosynthesis
VPTILINALASTAGGGITYLHNVLPRLSDVDRAWSFVALVPEGLGVISRMEPAGSVECLSIAARGTASRLWWEQTQLRRVIRERRVDVLVALGNIALFRSPIPQVLFNRNDLYFSAEFERDLRSRGLYGELLSNRLKRWLSLRSISAADVNLTPTAAFAERLSAFNGNGKRQFTVIPFGFDRVGFRRHEAGLDQGQLKQLELSKQRRRLLYVSHYNYFRNFETLIRALPHLPEDIQLVLTTEIRAGAVYGGYDATAASRLIDELGVRSRIAMLGSVKYERLHHLYDVCDAFVCPSYSESFGHPLVEAMASGLPVIAANHPVHREVCGEAAAYFETFDETSLARQCIRVLDDRSLAAEMKEKGYAQSGRYSWDSHVDQLVRVIAGCLTPVH